MAPQHAAPSQNSRLPTDSNSRRDFDRLRACHATQNEGIPQDGPYTATILAVGAQFGTLETYVAAFEGVEVSSNGPSEDIQLYESQLGGEVPYIGGVGAGAGAWITEHSEGTYLFLSGDFLTEGDSIGFGWSSNCLAGVTDPIFD